MDWDTDYFICQLWARNLPPICSRWAFLPFIVKAVDSKKSNSVLIAYLIEEWGIVEDDDDED